MVDELAVGAQAAGEEEDLRMEGPGPHVGVEISQVGVLPHRFVERLPGKAAAQELDERGLAHTDIAGHSDELLHQSSPARVQAPLRTAQASINVSMASR